MALRNISLNTKLILIVIIFFSIPQFIKSDTNVDDNNLIPVHYDVKIQLDMYRNFFFGECNITINITRQNISNISLPSINFGIMQLNIIDVNNERNKIVITVSKFSFINETQIYIDFNDLSTNILVPGQYILQIIYVRDILDDKNFLRSLYNEEDGTKGLDETGVEVLKAQQIFPCWYGPAFNATFTLSIKHLMIHKVISNMHIKKKVFEKNDELMWTYFAKSPSMPIEYLTIVITSFSIVSIEYNFTTSLSDNATVWCRERTTTDIMFADVILSHIVDLLLKYNVVTEINKIDYVAYWDTRHSNILTWGLILQREESILYNNQLDSIARKIEVADFLANHVLSVWCGSIDWPIEGFNTYFGADILAQIKDLHYMEQLFAVKVQQESYRFDTPSTGETNFTTDRKDKEDDVYPYSLKASVLWRELRHILQHSVFWFVISTYTIRHKMTGRARYEDLWLYVQNSLDANPDFPTFNITDYINTWQSKNYYPVIYVEQNPRMEYLEISYASDQIVDDDEHPVPALITYFFDYSEHDYEKQFWLIPDGDKRFEDYNLSNVILVNLEQQGYYRVHYDYENWHKISNYLSTNHTKVHNLDLAQVIDDAFYFLTVREVGLTMFWNLAYFLAQSTSYIAWHPMFKIFEYMACMYNFDGLVEIRKHMDHILSKVLQQIGYDAEENEEDLVMCLREEAAKWACLIDNSECRTAATVRLIDDIRIPVQDNRYTWKEWKYCKGLMSANETVWRNTYNSLQRQTPDIRILEYLTCCNDHFFITTYLNQTTLKSNQSLETPIINVDPLFPVAHRRVIIILLTVAKHAKKNVVLDFILNRLESEQLSMTENWNRDRIIILIVAITNLSSNSQLQKISVFATNHVDKKQIVTAIKKRIRKRKAEFGRKVTKYGTLQYHMNK